MDYSRIYDEIINNAISENRYKGDIYYERHHIIPKALGGDNTKNNLVLLTAREHYIAHKCLPLIYKEKGDINAYHKMNHALHMFLYSKNNDGYKISSRDYSKIKSLHAEAASALLTGKIVSDETKVNMSIAQKEYFDNNPGHFTGKTHTVDTISSMRDNNIGNKNPMYGVEHSIESRNKISASMKGVKKSAETIEKFKNRKLSPEHREKLMEGLRKYHAKRKLDKATL